MGVDRGFRNGPRLCFQSFNKPQQMGRQLSMFSGSMFPDINLEVYQSPKLKRDVEHPHRGDSRRFSPGTPKPPIAAAREAFLLCVLVTVWIECVSCQADILHYGPSRSMGVGRSLPD